MRALACLFLSLLIAALCGPSLCRVAFGPRTQSDVLHSLMHEKGADIAAEDAEAHKSAEKAENAATKGKVAPIDQEEFLHGVGMHGDQKKAAYEAQEEEKGPGAPSGPCQGMDCLHGVLMHGDAKPGDSHAHDHAEAAKKTKAREDRDAKQASSVEDPHEVVHGHRKSLAESAADNKRYASHRGSGPPLKAVPLEVEPEPEPSYLRSFLQFLKRKLVGEEEEEEVDEMDAELKGTMMDMRQDLQSIGRTGLSEDLHKHSSKSKRQERAEHTNNAHREH